MPYNSRFEHLIFDFDGTIADSIYIAKQIYHKLALRYTSKELSELELEDLRQLTAGEIIKKIKIPFWIIPFAVIEARKEYCKQVYSIKPCQGMIEVIAEVAKDYQLHIITSNHIDAVLKFLEIHQIRGYFSSITAGASIFGKSKKLRSFITKNKLKTTNTTLYIGDEIRDIQAAQKNGITSVAVGWGFNSKEILAKHNPEYLITLPSNLLEILESNLPSSKN